MNLPTHLKSPKFHSLVSKAYELKSGHEVKKVDLSNQLNRLSKRIDQLWVEKLSKSTKEIWVALECKTKKLKEGKFTKEKQKEGINRSQELKFEWFQFNLWKEPPN